MTPEERSASFSSAALRHLAELSEIRGDWTESARLRRAAGAIDSREPASNRQPDTEPWRSDRELESEIRRARARIPWLLRRLVEVNALPTSEAVALARVGILTFADLAYALHAKPAAQFGTVTHRQLCETAETLSSELRLITLGRATDVVELLLTRLGETCPTLEGAIAAGGVRRYEPLVDSLVIAARAAEPEAVIGTIATLPDIDDVMHRASRRLIVTYNRVEVDVRVAAPDEYGSVLHAATGPPEHVAAIAARRRSSMPCAREADVYAEAGLPFIVPELRHGTGEVEDAAGHNLPALVEVAHIRGDLHLHSTYSDGQDPLEWMVSAACALGYEYIAITDHSERAAAARTVTLDALARQRDEVAGLREKYPAIAILHGIEVDIMPDGRLDFADDVLASLDIVLASLMTLRGKAHAR